jgi:hypothetical protein
LPVERGQLGEKKRGARSDWIQRWWWSGSGALEAVWWDGIGAAVKRVVVVETRREVAAQY